MKYPTKGEAEKILSHFSLEQRDDFLDVARAGDAVALVRKIRTLSGVIGLHEAVAIKNAVQVVAGLAAPDGGSVPSVEEELEWASKKKEEAPGDFLKSFITAMFYADGENYELLRPIIWQMMKKYPVSYGPGLSARDEDSSEFSQDEGRGTGPDKYPRQLGRN